MKQRGEKGSSGSKEAASLGSEPTTMIKTQVGLCFRIKPILKESFCKERFCSEKT